jgi:hypothetical protein
VSGVSVQDLTPQLPDTRNLTPETYKLRLKIISDVAAPQWPLFPGVVSEKLGLLVKYPDDTQ